MNDGRGMIRHCRQIHEIRVAPELRQYNAFPELLGWIVPYHPEFFLAHFLPKT
jgi:hypothetical protein